ncbi:formate/nitrite transporter family protein [Rubrimonas cliftonensis]|uniref:Formate/nitrite transporter n=1 Tax=Rubrimonas cliftonensis TaxID=89524 RepID=A0A1H4B4Z4_9RHOB|nr:formate/nitrite transporter family protein [Rubrimonas cliftonensis]SEA43156.1 formate/nitrite transporter [Rubrimonas cliftonensis]
MVDSDRNATAPQGAQETMLTPSQIGDALVASCVAKASASARATFALGVLGGAFIAFGGAFFTAVMVGAEPGLGAARMLGGLVFSLGLALVLVAGAELFTGNAMMLLAVWRGAMGVLPMLRNWGLVLAGNAAGALAVVALMSAGGLFSGGHGAVAAAIAEGKFAEPTSVALARGVMCNVLVCLAVWMSLATRNATGKVVAVALPVAAFITIGFEHSVANLYLLPAGLVSGAAGGLPDLMGNLPAVLLGNLVGAGLVAGLYAWALDPSPAPASGRRPAAQAIPQARPGMPSLAAPRPAPVAKAEPTAARH